MGSDPSHFFPALSHISYHDRVLFQAELEEIFNEKNREKSMENESSSK
jgi:hypothetical protein